MGALDRIRFLAHRAVLSGEHLTFGGLEPRRTYGLSDSFSRFIAKRKQASRTPNASRIMTSRSMSQPQCLKEQPNLAAAFGVREACFRFGVSEASIAFERHLENWPPPTGPRSRRRQSALTKHKQLRSLRLASTLRKLAPTDVGGYAGRETSWC